jgi:hypothetical protein
VAASLHGDTPYSGNSVTPVPVTPYTTSVDVNWASRGLRRLIYLTARQPHLELTQGHRKRFWLRS